MTTKMNPNSPAAYSILNPNPNTVQYDAARNVRILVHTEADSLYLNVAQMVDLARQGYIKITDVDSSALPGDYGRTAVSYKIL